MSSTQFVEHPAGAPQGTTPAEVNPPRQGPRPARSAAAYLVALLLLAPSLCWVLLDRSVWLWDAAWYGEVSVELYYTLAHKTRAWPAAMTRAIPSKPPGLTWLGQFFVPLGQLIGSIDRGLHVPILLLQGITLVMIYRIGRALSPTHGAVAGLAGCALVGAAPLFVAMSHEYLVEPLQTMTVAWFFYCALFSARWSRLRILNHLVAATAVALLAKTTTPVFCLLPGLMAAAQLLLRRPAAGRAVRWALAGQLLGLALGLGLLAWTAVWYRTNWQSVCTHAYQSSVGEVALQYGHKDVFLRKLAFWFTALREGLFTAPLFWMGALLALTGIATWGWRLHRAGWLRRPALANGLALSAGLQVAAVLAVFSLTIPEDTRYLTAALPATAVLLMWAVAQVPLRVAGVVFAATALAQWGYIHSITLGLTDWKSHCWLAPVETDPTQSDEATQVVGLTSGDREAADRSNVVGVELRWCNANAFAYYAAKNKLAARRRAYFTSLGYAETDVNRALNRLDLVNTVYFISVEEGAQPKPPDFLNLVSAPVLAKLEGDGRFARVRYLSRLGILVFKRMSH